MKGKQGMKRAPLVVVVIVAMMLFGCGVMGENVKTDKSGSAPLTEKAVNGLVKALQEAGGYTTVALLLPYLAPILQKKTTLLIPSDEAIRRGLPSWRPPLSIPADSARPFSFLFGQQLRWLAKLHIIKSANFSFSDLLKLPPGTLLPTLLGPPHYLSIMHKSSPHDLVINNAHLHHPDLCPPSLSPFVTCHGINSLLSPLFNSSLFPTRQPLPPLINSSYPSPPYTYSYNPSPPPPPPPPPSTMYFYSPPPTVNHTSPYPTYSSYASPASYPTSTHNYSSPYPTSYNSTSYGPPLYGGATLPPLMAVPPNATSPELAPSSETPSPALSPTPTPTPPLPPASSASHSYMLTVLPILVFTVTLMTL